MKTKPSLSELFGLRTTFGSNVAKRLLIITALSSALFALRPAPCALSQIPQGFNYQAIARDMSTGNPITEPIDVRIAILSDDDPETIIREEQFIAVDPDDHGLFSLVVGQGSWVSGLANFSDIDWSVTPKYIKTMIWYGGGWKDMGPAQLWSVPYAMYSPSTNPWSLNGSTVYYSSGFVGVGWGAPWARFQVTENASTAITYPVQLVNMSDDWTATEKGVGLRFGRNANFSSHGWGTVRGTIAEGDGGHGRLQLIGGSGDLPHVTVKWDGNVGIGTAEPAYKLDIAGRSRFQAGGGSAGFWLMNNANTLDRGFMGMYEDNYMGFYGQGGAGWGMVMNVNNGNFGIGTLNPTNKLHVNGGITSGNIYIGGTVQTGISIFKADNPGDQKMTELLGLGGVGNFIGRFVNDAYTQADVWLNVVRNTGTYTVNSVTFPSGNVGVGSATTAKMAVQPPIDWSDEIPLFEVKNRHGIPVLAVYNNGVRINVEHNEFTKSNKGGFSVGGYDYAKATETVDLMIINPDSIRFNINNTYVPGKGAKGGFSVGGFTESKGGINQDFMYITPQNNNVDNAYNTFLGYQAGNKNIYGDYNTFIGYQAGYNHVGYSVPGGTGNGNVYIGHLAGFTPTYGTQNTFIGYESGSQADRTVGLVAANTFMGYQSGERSSGSSNILLGHSAGYDQSTYGSKTSTGSHNIMIGNKAGGGYTSASYNVLIGPSSGFHLSSGDNNVCIGEYTGREMRTSYQNVLIGNFAGEYIGSNQPNPNYDNVVIGYYAGNKVIGNGNVIIGKYAAKNMTTISNRLFIDNTETSAPLIYGEFDSRLIKVNGDVIAYTSLINNSMELDLYGSGDRNNLIDFHSDNTYTDYGFRIIKNSGANGWTDLIHRGTGSLTLRTLDLGPIRFYTNGAQRMVINESGNVMINSTSPSALFYVNGTAGGTSDWAILSDKRYKNNINEIENAVDLVKDLVGVYYEWSDSTIATKGRHIGFLAQDVMKILPEVVSYENEKYSVQYGPINAVLVEAVKEQQKQIESQNEKIARLEKLVQELMDK